MGASPGQLGRPGNCFNSHPCRILWPPRASHGASFSSRARCARSLCTPAADDCSHRRGPPNRCTASCHVGSAETCDRGEHWLAAAVLCLLGTSEWHSLQIAGAAPRQEGFNEFYQVWQRWWGSDAECGQNRGEYVRAECAVPALVVDACGVH